MATISFKTIDGKTVTLPAKDYLYQKKDDKDSQSCVVVFYTGEASEGGFSNTPYPVSLQQAEAIAKEARLAILGF